MSEKQRSRRQRESAGGGPALWGDPGPSGSGDTQLVTVSHGPFAEELPVAEMTVGEVRARFRDRFDIDPEAQAFVDGQPASEETRLGSGEVLVFTRRAGEKGGPWWRP